MDIIVASVTVLTIAVIAAKVLLNYRDFKNEEFQYTMDRNATDEGTTGDHIYEWIERQGEVTRRHACCPPALYKTDSGYYFSPSSVQSIQQTL